MKLCPALAMLLCCCAAPAQQPAAPLQFEVASIKPSAPMQMGRIRVSMDADGSMLRYSGVSLRDCIRAAYKVKDFQVEGPDWLNAERFDIVAKFPAGSTREQTPELLQALLAERFKLKIHRETKEHAVYALVVAKGGPRLKASEAPATPPPGAGPGGPGRGNTMMTMGPEGAHLKSSGATIAGLTDVIARFTGRPVIDATGIQGEYDFDLTFMPENMPGMPGGGRMMAPPPAGGPAPAAAEAPAERPGSIVDAIQPYGLKLESRKAPVELLIVDHAEKSPTEN